jgi:ubiquinone biosynthesis protein
MFTVLWLAARIYAGYKSVQLWTRFVRDDRKHALYQRQDLRAARALYRAAIKLEGLLIKASQFIATRADILPDAWVNTLSGLHDRVPPRPFGAIRAQVERETGRALESTYNEFDPIPVAAASLAQVHRARLKDGRACAVKVQYPGIEQRVAADLRNLTLALKILARLEPSFDFTALATELLKYVPMELDFVNEARNCDQVRRNFAGREDVIVPEVYWEATTRRVLTMEFVEGIQVSDVAGLERAGIDKHAVAQKLTEIYCEQILHHGFFQADPHPGNILVRPGPQLVLLDFGLSKDFPASFREGVVRLTFSILTGDRAAIARAFDELGFKTRDGSLDTLVVISDLLLGNVIKRQRSYADPELIEEISEQLPRALRRNPVVHVPADILLIGRVMGLLSGLGKTLDSQVNLLATVMPYAQRLMSEQVISEQAVAAVGGE